MGAAVWRLDQLEDAAFSPVQSVTRWWLSDLLPKEAAGITAAPCRGLGEPLGWRPVHASPTGFINTHERHGDADGVVYVANRFHVPRARLWGLRLGHDGGVRVFVDGQRVLTEPALRNPAEPGRSRAEVSLAEGQHELVIALDTAAGKGCGIFFEWALPRAERRFPAAVSMTMAGGRDPKRLAVDG